MKMWRFLWAGGMCAGLFFAATCKPESARRIDFGGGISPEGLKAHLEFLADDALEGRRTGTRGYEIAAKYMAAQFASLGFQGGMPEGSFFQRVPLRRGDVVPEATSITLGTKAKTRVLKHGGDFLLFNTHLESQGEIAAPVVFAGYGVSAPEFNYDDYAGLDVRGKIVAILSADAPPDFPGDARAYYTLFDVKRAIAADHGAVAILGVRTPKIESSFPWPFRQRGLANGFSSMGWQDRQGRIHGLDERLGPWADLNRPAAEILFDQEKSSLSEVFGSAEKGQSLHFPLVKTAAIRYESRHTEIRCVNVIAMLKGADPALKDDYVVFTAHLDHLGIGAEVDGDSIYNGALDNASGCATLLEIAKAFKQSKLQPRRSILFAAVTGEEQGNLGSDYLANNLPVPKDSIVADINLDGSIGFGPVRDVVVFGQSHSSLKEVAERAGAECDFVLSPEPQPERGLFVRTDHLSFIRIGVPSVFLSPGYKSNEPGIDGLKALLEWSKSVYHTPQDDIRLGFDYVTGARFAQFAGLMGYKIAMDTSRPKWVEGDFFGLKFANSR